jgi:hypothetical protein
LGIRPVSSIIRRLKRTPTMPVHSSQHEPDIQSQPGVT